MLVILFFFQFFLNSTLHFLPKSKNNKALIFVISLVFFYTLFLGVTDTADWEGYVYIFEEKEKKTDFLFRYISMKGASYGYTFTDIYKLHIIIYGFLFALFISRFTQNIFLVLLFYVLIAYVPLANQIRYYMGFGLYINGLYLLYFTRKQILSYLFFALAIISHSAIIVLLGFVFLNKYSIDKNYLKRCYLLAFALFTIVFSFENLGLSSLIDKYVIYFSQENVSNVIGGIYNSLPYIIMLILLQMRKKKVLKKYKGISDDKVFNFLYRLSFFTIIFIPASFYIQILAHRYVNSFLIIWLCFYLYTLKFEKSSKLIFNHIIGLTAIMIFLFYYTYFFSEIVLGEISLYYIEFVKSFNSIDYFPDIII